MQVLVGTSGYSYDAWKGSFYPRELPTSQRLRYYAERLPTVEINSTFYQLPTTKTLTQWAGEVPPNFVFVLKASQRITHRLRLANAAEATAHLFEVSTALGDKRGAFLFQLPPFLKKDLPRLVGFLDGLPDRMKATFEFRHPSWFEDDVYEALRVRGAALCVADTDEGQGPIVSTADWGYLRLRRTDYSEAELDAWAERIDVQPWQRAYVFFKHEDEGKGPKLASTLLHRMASRGTS
jgi:uncharacterized protein YecE (DUF72 family)